MRTLGEEPRPYVYEMSTRAIVGGMEFVVKGDGTSEELLATALAVLDEVDPDLVLLEAKTMNEHLALLSVPAPYGGAAAIGLRRTRSAVGGGRHLGVVSHAVARRTRRSASGCR